STLYRKRAAGFGEWEITIAPNAERDLRVYSRRDRGTFFLIVKKMRDLSNGDFSRDNYRQINGSNIEIPIYQAKVTNDLRLVYQIDCAPTHDAKVRAFIFVFGIYEDAQLSGGSFWESMSRQLGKKGEEYKDRCTRRQRAPGTDEAGFLPIEFSVQEEARLNPGSVPDLPSDDAEQVCALSHILCDLSAIVRQPLLESIMADLDVAFVLKISPKELDIIEHPHSCYVLGRSGTGKTTTMLYKMLLVEVSDEANPEFRKSRQLFVTQSRILAEKVGEHFGKLLGGYRPSALSENAKAAIKADRALVAGEESDWRSDLPKKYSDLQDADFPLFVSFDQLCTMLERDMEATGDVENGLATSPWLTFKRFKSEYWPHFPEALRKGFDPSMVFSEFLGVIMGSEQALASGSSRLDRDVYLNLGKRGQSTFADQRDRIYDLFEKYTSQKRRQNDYDAADRTHAILRFLQSHGNPGRNIDYLYVDEAQDNLLLDGLGELATFFWVLRYLCPNTQGLFWAGDTAQTINVGSSFRFNELKAFFFRIEVGYNIVTKFSSPTAAPPRTFQLTVNYRSHSGIVNCAHSVIEVITKLWPDAIDLLERERGTVDGLRPIFFTSWDSENIDSKQFLFGNQAGSYNELGAHQCIIVRNEAAKENLQKEVGEIGLIMTLPESKGLEFNDVLLYNFFEDSNVLETQWRVVLNAMDRSKDTPPAPPFDKIRHASVCTELKSLYVAITRARNNIWIADCSTKGEPMRTLWKSQDLVQNCGLGTDTPRFAISSTPAEWESRGRQLFDNQLFSQARLSFEHAYMPHEAAVAQAYHHREVANEMPNNSRREIAAKKAALIEVANAFVGCAKNDPGDAAKVYFRRAGECFEHAGDVTQAINAYTGARHFSRVAELYRSLGKIDEAVATVQNHPQDISRDTVERVFGVARLFYFNKGQIEKAGRLFDTLEEALEYLEDRGLNAERATLLEILGRSSDAAEIHLAEGRTPEAVTLFLQDHQPDRAIQCVLHGLWQRISFATWQSKSTCLLCQEATATRFVLISDAADPVADLNIQISVFLDLANGKVSNPLFAGQLFTGSNNGALALFCLDHYFTNPPRTQALSTKALAEHLQIFLAYVKLLYHFAFNVDPCNSDVAEKLFGFRKEGENNYSIRQGAFIRRALSNTSGGNDLITGSDLRLILRQSLSGRLVERVRVENEMCRMTKAFEGPCLTFAIYNGHCNRVHCPQEHILSSPSQFNAQEYNLRVRIHLQQILIYQSLYHTNIDQFEFEQRSWISRLYAALNPPSYQLGSAHCLDFSLIPEAEAALQVVKEWIRSLIYALHFTPEIHFLTHMVQLAHLAFQFDAPHAMTYLTRGPFMLDERKPLMYRRPPEGRYVVAEFLSVLEDQEQFGISAGVMFLRHIITHKHAAYIDVICDVAEYLCAGLVVADRLDRVGSLHDITLPLSWLVKRASAPGGLGRARDTVAFWRLAESLVELLDPVYSGAGADHLLFDHKNLGDKTLGFRIRQIFLARICRCLCLLAYNFRSNGLRDYVFNSITLLRWRDPTRMFTFLCTRYVNANGWADLTRAVRSSTDGAALDEMVQLLHASGPRPRAFRSVRQIVYEKIEDIPQLLGSSPLTAPTKSASYAYQTGDTALTQTKEDGEDVPEDGEVDTDERLPDDAPIQMPSVLEPEERSEEELKAAAKIRKAILRTHRRVEERKKGSGKPSLSAGLSELFAECRGESVMMDQPHHRLYRVYFLGPLPHLLLCLDIVHTRAQKERNQTRKELTSADHEAYEKLDRKLTDFQRTLKRVIDIQKGLKPTATIHARRSVSELKSKAEEAVSLLQELPFAEPQGLREHVHLAAKAFVQTWKTTTRRAEPKPQLNTEEELY
ncbi:hypothetical protein B0H11DRAFT_1725402, partial [Mycena galericulata]